MSIVVVGTAAYDTIYTPTTQATDVLGGSATYFSFASSFYSKTKVIAKVGEDFSKKHLQLFHKHNINIDGIEILPGKTFRWKGKYSQNLNERTTIETQLNVLQDLKISIPKSYLSCNVLFLANIDPDIQLEVISQIKSAEFIAMDTMNFWIASKMDLLKKLFKQIHLLCINESEAELLSGQNNIVKAARLIRKLGPSVVVIKRGSYGAILFYDNNICAVPAYPLEEVVDPTGAGDSFAGGFLGYLNKIKKFTMPNFRKALAYGNIIASFTVEDFSIYKLTSINKSDIKNRYLTFKRITSI